MKFNLPSFTLTVRDLTDEELQSNRGGIAEGRDYYAVDIRHKHGALLTCCVGSPIIMTRGEVWDETKAAMSALSFASEPSCWDEPCDINWAKECGDKLTNEAYCHRTLGKELRS